MRRYKPRCGKYGRIPSAIREEILSTLEWDMGSEGYITGEGVQQQGSPTGKLITLCDCGNMWRFKRRTNIKSLMKDKSH